MRAVAYLRISDDRVGLELGVARQREDCRVVARSRGWELAAEFVDNDISATSGKPRPGYIALMASVARGEVDCVIVYMTSRLWRNPQERLDGRKLFALRSIRLVPVKGPELDFSSAMGRMVAGILGEVDTAEVEIKSERSSREALQRAEQGRYHGGPKAYGVTADGTGLVESEAAELRRWYDLILAGGSITSIVRATGRHHSSVVAILRNPRNAGLRMLGGNVFPASNPPIVPESTWRAVLAILDDPVRRLNDFGSAHRWIGAGLFQCDCGNRVKTSNSGHKRVYQCATSRGGCGRSWKAEPIDTYVSDVVAERLSRPDVADLLPREAAPQVADLSAEAAGIRQRLGQLGAAFGLDDQADLVEFRAATTALRERLAAIETRMASGSGTDALAAIALTEDPAAAWLDVSDVTRRKAILNALMTVVLHQSPRGRPSHFRKAREVVEIAWKR